MGHFEFESSDIFYKSHTHFNNLTEVQGTRECGVNFRTKMILFDLNYLLICCSWVKNRAFSLHLKKYNENIK